MPVIIKHAKTGTIADWTQADLDQQIAAGNYPPGTVLADIVLPSDWNNDHTFTGLGTMAEQDANNVAITGGTINNTTIGATTASTGTFTTLIGGANVANYGQLTGGATTKAVEFVALGTDSNISIALDSKGTGAIDLAAGSSGVNISNGGTVTAITRTATGSGYTSNPTIAVSTPTTASGVQAVITGTLGTSSPTITSGGTGYTVGNTLTLVGGTGTASTLTVSTVSGGVITGVTTASAGAYTVLPTSPVSVTGGSGSGATFTLVAGNTFVNSAFTITNAGSGYIEQPTITFSGGGGSGASAFASVGALPIVKSLHTEMQFSTAAGIGFEVQTYGAGTTTSRFATFASSSGNPAVLEPRGASGNIASLFSSKGTSALQFYTNSFTLGTGAQQLAVTHTASAVNYMQVTGGATGVAPVMSAQGSDAAVPLTFNTKSTGSIRFNSTGGTYTQFRIDGTTSAVNYLDVWGSIAGAAPSVRVAGTDTDIDLTLTPKGTGRVRFGTYTGTILTPTGFIEIKDSGGTTRRLLVG